jgi:RNA polymerase sigma-70 factor (ECF subfamily)
MPGVWAVSDEALVAGLAGGDPDAAAAFVRRFQARVYGLAVGMLGDRGVAEDVAQEVFVRAWRHAAAYDPRRGSVSTWLLAIAHNLAVDVLRTRRAAPLDPATIEALAAPTPGSGTEGAAVAVTEVERVRLALAHLPPEQRRTLVLARFTGMTAAEISRQEGVPLGTVKTRLRAGLARLREQLAVEHQ